MEPEVYRSLSQLYLCVNTSRRLFDSHSRAYLLKLRELLDAF
jgi:hypothetical protein